MASEPAALLRARLEQQLDRGRTELRSDAAPRPGPAASPPRSLTMRVLLASSEPSPRLLLLLAGLLAALRLYRALQTGLALLRALGWLPASGPARLPAPSPASARLAQP